MSEPNKRVGFTVDGHYCAQTGCSSVRVKFHRGNNLVSEYLYQYDDNGATLAPTASDVEAADRIRNLIAAHIIGGSFYDVTSDESKTALLEIKTEIAAALQAARADAEKELAESKKGNTYLWTRVRELEAERDELKAADTGSRVEYANAYREYLVARQERDTAYEAYQKARVEVQLVVAKITGATPYIQYADIQAMPEWKEADAVKEAARAKWLEIASRVVDLHIKFFNVQNEYRNAIKKDALAALAAEERSEEPEPETIIVCDGCGKPMNAVGDIHEVLNDTADRFPEYCGRGIEVPADIFDDTNRAALDAAAEE